MIQDLKVCIYYILRKDALILVNRTSSTPYGPNTRLIAFFSAVSGLSGAYARRQARVGSIMSMHQGPLLQIVPAEIARARGFMHAPTQLCADRQTHAQPQAALVQNSTPQAAAR